MRFMIILTILAMTAAAYGGANPHATMYVSFDPSGAPVHSVETEIYTMCNAYVCLANIEGGVSSVVFALNDLLVDYPGMFAPPLFTALWWFP